MELIVQANQIRSAEKCLRILVGTVRLGQEIVVFQADIVVSLTVWRQVHGWGLQRMRRLKGVQ